MLTLYHAPTTRSFRIKWLLLELGLPYQEIRIDFYGTDRHAAAYRRVSPMGSCPALQDGALTLTESGAIVNHLLRCHGQGRFVCAPGSHEAAVVDEWMYWSEGLFAIHQRMYWDHGIPPPGCIEHTVPSVGEYGKRYAIRYAGALEQVLRDDGYLLGSDLTGADFMLCYPLFLANKEGWFDQLPRIRGYVRRFSARPAFVQAIADTLAQLAHLRNNRHAMPSWRSLEPPEIWNPCPTTKTSA